MNAPLTTLGLKAAQHSLLRLAEHLGEASYHIREAIKDCDEYDNFLPSTIVADDAISSLSELEIMSSFIRGMLEQWSQHVIESHKP